MTNHHKPDSNKIEQGKPGVDFRTATVSTEQVLGLVGRVLFNRLSDRDIIDAFKEAGNTEPFKGANLACRKVSAEDLAMMEAYG
jgi:hypothetical protein